MFCHVCRSVGFCLGYTKGYTKDTHFIHILVSSESQSVDFKNLKVTQDTHFRNNIYFPYRNLSHSDCTRVCCFVFVYLVYLFVYNMSLDNEKTFLLDVYLLCNLCVSSCTLILSRYIHPCLTSLFFYYLRISILEVRLGLRYQQVI